MVLVRDALDVHVVVRPVEDHVVVGLAVGRQREPIVHSLEAVLGQLQAGEESGAPEWKPDHPEGQEQAHGQYQQRKRQCQPEAIAK